MRTENFWIWAVVLTMGCGGGGSPPAKTSSEAKVEPGAPNIPWEQKNHDQRLEWMGLEVFPKMKEAFQGYDEVEFKDFKCQTCHGDNMKEVNFKMPNELPPLSKENTFAKAQEYDAEATAFMAETVVPTMAKLLGKEPYDQSTGEGFGCFGCHPTEE